MKSNFTPNVLNLTNTFPCQGPHHRKAIVKAKIPSSFAGEQEPPVLAGTQSMACKGHVRIADLTVGEYSNSAGPAPRAGRCT